MMFEKTLAFGQDGLTCDMSARAGADVTANMVNANDMPIHIRRFDSEGKRVINLNKDIVITLKIVVI